MTKFKVGDKVRILHTDYNECGLDVGTIHSVTAIRCGLANLEGVYDDTCRKDRCFYDHELEFVDDGTLTVGQTYTSKNGHEWLCIAVNGEYAHMRYAYVPSSSAYCFKTDGTSICLGGDYDVQFEPVRESIEVHGSFDSVYRYYAPDYITLHEMVGDHKFTMTIDMVDGEPDWSSAKLTGA